jgi:hypothetical protein
MNSRTVLIGLIFLLFSFSSKAQQFNKRPPLVDLKDIKEITIFHPSSWIELSSEGLDEVYLNPSSLKSVKLNLELLDTWKRVFQSAYIFPEEEIPDLGVFSLDLRELADKASVNASLEDLRVTPALFQLISNTDTQYHMFVYHEGYILGKAFYRGRDAPPVSVNGEIFEDYSPVPLTNLSSLYVFVMDQKLGHAVFARKVELSEVHPLRKRNLSKQYKFIFKEFY